MKSPETNILPSLPIGETMPASKRPGEDWLPANGTLLPNASRDFPGLSHFLTTHPEVVVSEEEWANIAEQYYRIHPDYPHIPAEGGVLFFAFNHDSDTIRLPDLRGMVSDSARFQDRLVFPSPGEKLTNYVKVR